MRDVNGTSSRLVLGAADWQAIATGDAVWDGRRGGLVLRPTVEIFALPAGDTPPSTADRGAAVALPGGSIVWTEPGATALAVFVPGETSRARFWPDPLPAPTASEPGAFTPAPGAPAAVPAISALAAAEGRLLFAATPGAILAFDLRSGHAPRTLRWPTGELREPRAIAASPDGALAIHDGDGDRVWRLNRALLGAPVAASAGGPFLPVEAPPEIPPSQVRPLTDAVTVTGAPGTIALGLTADNLLLAVTQRPSGDPQVVEIGAAGPGAPVALTGPSATAIRAHDAVVLRAEPDDESGAIARVVIADGGGNQAWSFGIGRAADGSLTAALEPQFLPMRRYDGTALASDGVRVHYHGATTWNELVAQPRPRCAEEASVRTAVLDSEVAGCVWHRVFLEGDLPAGASLSVHAIAGDDQALLVDDAPWVEQPTPRRRPTSPHPYTPPLGDCFELLLQEVRGRYARIAITLRSDGRRSPVVRSLEVTGPRFSLRDRYLPAVFTETDHTGLLERLLANPEGEMTELEGRIAASQALLSPSAAPSEALDWLAAWLDLAIDPAFGDRRRRLFVRHAHRLLAMRGTPRGLQLALRLALDPGVDDRALTDPTQARTSSIRIVEAYQLRHGRAVAAGDPTAVAQERDPAARWRPEQGAAALHDRWRTATGEDRFPPRPQPVTTTWVAFCEETLGYRPGTTAADDARRGAFLERRHGTLARAAAVHGRASGDVARWPDTLPESPQALRDWHDGGAVVLAAARLAHRFSVLLPVCDGERPDDDVVLRRVAIAERVVSLQKPAHTVAAVRLYWSAFRVGYARLGADSAVSERVPVHFDAVLGRRALGAAVLGGPRRPFADAITPRRNDA